MFGFFKKLLGLPVEAEKAQEKTAQAPYKVEAPVAKTPTVETQITDAVTAPAKPKSPAKIKGGVRKSSNTSAGTKKPGRKPKAK
jgi:hypothetical protein